MISVLVGTGDLMKHDERRIISPNEAVLLVDCYDFCCFMFSSGRGLFPKKKG